MRTTGRLRAKRRKGEETIGRRRRRALSSRAKRGDRPHGFRKPLNKSLFARDDRPETDPAALSPARPFALSSLIALSSLLRYPTPLRRLPTTTDVVVICGLLQPR